MARSRDRAGRAERDYGERHQPDCAITQQAAAPALIGGTPVPPTNQSGTPKWIHAPPQARNNLVPPPSRCKSLRAPPNIHGCALFPNCLPLAERLLNEGRRADRLNQV